MQLYCADTFTCTLHTFDVTIWLFGKRAASGSDRCVRTKMSLEGGRGRGHLFYTEEKQLVNSRLKKG